MSKITLVLAALVLGAAVGRYSLPAKIEIKTVEVEKKQTDIDRDKHKETVTTTKEHPDGTKETTTTVVENTKTKKETTNEKAAGSESTTTYSKGGVVVSALAAIKINDLGPPSYGAMVSSRLIGPIHGGAFFLTNTTFGVSLGLEF